MSGQSPAPANAVPASEGAALVRDPTGLHAPPAVKLTKLAKRFAAAVQVRAGDGAWVNAKSTAGVMKLKPGTASASPLRPPARTQPRRSRRWSPWSSATSMTEAAGGMVLRGVAASPGLAIGPIALERPVRLLRREAGPPDEEVAALRAAIAAAAAQLAALGEAAPDDLAAQILEFQQALLEDDDLIDPAQLATLLDLGLRRISVAPARLGPVKAAIAAWPQGPR